MRELTEEEQAEYASFKEYCVYGDLTSGSLEERRVKLERLHAPKLDGNCVAQFFREMFPLPVASDIAQGA